MNNSEQYVAVNRKRRYGQHPVCLIFMLLVILGLSGWYNSSSAQAAGAQINVKPDQGTITEGQYFYLVITVTSTDEMSGFEGYFSYNSRVMKYITGGSVASGNDNEFHISDMNRDSTSKTLKYSIKFYARKSGSSPIVLKSPYGVYMGDDFTKMSVSYHELNLKIHKDSNEPTQSEPVKESKEPKKPQDNSGRNKKGPNKKSNKYSGSSYLEKLQAEEMELTPEFLPNIFKYSGIYESEKNSLNLSCKAQDPEARIVIKGNDELKEGRNVIKIIVYSVKKEKTVYQLTIDKKQVDQKDTGGLKASSEDDVQFLYQETFLQVIQVPDSSIIPEGFKETTLEITGESIPAYALENKENPSFYLIYCSRGDNKPAFYLYHTKDAALERYDHVKTWYGLEDTEYIPEKSVVQNQLTVSRQRCIIIILGAVCGLLVIGLLFVRMHDKDGNEKDFK